MSFADKLAADMDEFRRAQKQRAWALTTGIVAAIYALGIANLVGFAVLAHLGYDTILAVLWVVGAVTGAASLLTIGVVRKPPIRLQKAAHIGLWIGNLVVVGNILVFPIVFPLALVPVIGGFVVLRQQSRLLGAAYLGLPFLALAVVVLTWAIGIPLGSINHAMTSPTRLAVTSAAP